MADRGSEVQAKRNGKPRKSPLNRGKKETNSNKADNSIDVATRRRKEIEASIRLQVAAEEKAHKIVEKLVLDEQVSEEFLVASGNFITPSHYSDVTQERAIAHVCGYPVCCKALLQIPKQQYKISCRTNRVYDIAERKWFCSSFCYKASKWFESQLSSSPVWSRDQKETRDFTLLGPQNETAVARRSTGDVLIGSNGTHELDSRRSGDTTTPMDWDRTGEDCAQRVQRQGDDSSANSEASGLTAAVARLQVSPPERSRPTSYDNPNPTFAATQAKPIKDGPFESWSQGFSRTPDEEERPHSGAERVAAEASDPEEKVLLRSVMQIARDWCTPATLNFLGCERPCGPGKDFVEFSRDNNRRQQVDTATQCPGEEAATPTNQQRNERGSDCMEASKETNIVIQERRPPRKQDTSRVLPPIDSRSQMTIRRRVVLDQLTKALPDLLREVRLTMGEISADLTRLVHTFSLGNRNSTLKPVQWNVLGLALLETLRCTNRLVGASLDSNNERVEVLLRSLGLTRLDLEGLVAVFRPSSGRCFDKSRSPAPGTDSRRPGAEVYYGDMEQLD